MIEISAQALKPLLTDGHEIAFLDVREHGQYGEGHPFFSVHLPFSKMEALAPKLMPNRGTRCVLMDNGDNVSARAGAVLEELGYTNVSYLGGGAPAWVAAGFTLFKGVNVPSKTFGELIEHAFHTKSISAEELQEMQKSGRNLLLLDGRPGSEYKKMSLPHALSCPNAELGYRLPTLCRDKSTAVVVNCAGRTRSIIGAQTLSLLNIPNPVYALRNGTQGWRLAGFNLNHGLDARPLPALSSTELDAGKKQADELCKNYELETISSEQAQEWLVDRKATTYLLDVRTREEYDHGHVQSARFAPGGQLVQATDEQIAVRNARIILSCDNGLRSATTAIWLRGMGHKVWLLDRNAPMMKTEDESPVAFRASDTIDVGELKVLIDAGVKVLDASNGLKYRAGHIEGARWITRARLDLDEIGDPEDWVLTGSCRILMAGIVSDLKAATGKAPKGVVKGHPDIWRSAGLKVVETPNSPTEEECIDYLFFVHDRHDGNLDAARRYLEWELGLLEQLDEQERGVLKPLIPSIPKQSLQNAS